MFGRRSGSACGTSGLSAYIQSQAGPELINFWDKEIQTRWDRVTGNPENKIQTVKGDLQRINLNNKAQVLAIKDKYRTSVFRPGVTKILMDKKMAEEIRMNVDVTPINKGARMTKYHVKTAAEVGHELEGAVYFNELNMGYGFHQMPLSTDTSQEFAVFQSQEGLNRIKWLYFGPKCVLRHLPPHCAQYLQRSGRSHTSTSPCMVPRHQNT